MTESNIIHYTKIIVGCDTPNIAYVRRILNDYFDTDEVADRVISDHINEVRFDYMMQTGNEITNWEAVSFNLNACINRWASLYVADGLSALAFGGGNMSYDLGALNIDRKDTTDNLYSFQARAEQCARRHGFHPMQGLNKVGKTTGIINTNRYDFMEY